MFLPDCQLFTVSLVDTAFILFLLMYFIITLSDVECDYLNSQQCCSRLNPWVIPKTIAHIFLSVLLLIHGHWILMLMNLPLAAWMAYEIISVPCGNLGIYDPTEIHNRGQLKKHMRDCLIHLGYYLTFFFIYLYCMIVAMLREDPLYRAQESQVFDEI